MHAHIEINLEKEMKTRAIEKEYGARARTHVGARALLKMEINLN